MLEIQNNTEIYKRIVDNISEGVWICDENFKTSYANESFCKMLGYKKPEDIQSDADLLWDEKSIEIITYNNTHTDQIEIPNIGGTLISKIGNSVPVLCNWSSIPGNGTMVTVRDQRELNSLKEAEETLKQANNTKNELISIVGHELRTPLTSIRGYLSMILDRDMGEINQPMRKALAHSYDSSVRLIHLVNDVLSLEKMESGKMEYYMENIDILGVMKLVYKDIYMEMENKNIEFKIEFPEELKEKKIYIDENKLRQVLLNLLTNALKFTHSGGVITLKTSIIRGNVRFEIIDTGEGIPTDKLDTLFNKFTQVESHLQRQNTSGLGLGLTIVKTFLLEFMSEIKVKSKPGKGSTFYFDLKIVK